MGDDSQDMQATPKQMSPDDFTPESAPVSSTVRHSKDTISSLSLTTPGTPERQVVPLSPIIPQLPEGRMVSQTPEGVQDAPEYQDMQDESCERPIVR
eukprot:2005023-Pyramimonas_sp.AAC.1